MEIVSSLYVRMRLRKRPPAGNAAKTPIVRAPLKTVRAASKADNTGPRERRVCRTAARRPRRTAIVFNTLL